MPFPRNKKFGQKLRAGEADLFQGGRSAKAVKLLLEKGFGKVVNVAGGINAWSERVDPNVPKY